MGRCHHRGSREVISDEEIAAAKAAGRFKSREELRATTPTDRLVEAEASQADPATEQPAAEPASEPVTGDVAPLPVEAATGAADEPADRPTAAQEPAVAPAVAPVEPNPWKAIAARQG